MENRLLRKQLPGRVRLSDGECQTLAEIGKKREQHAREAVASIIVEETAWDAQGHPPRGIVHAVSGQRDALCVPLQALHQRGQVKTCICYTGEQIPTDLLVVL
jgi:hypothetical protein